MENIIMNNVREYSENYPVELAINKDNNRLCLLASNEGGHNLTLVDLLDVIDWVKIHKSELINKPVETTNEQPKKYNLLEAFEDQFVTNNPPITIINSNKNVEIQLWGMAVILNENGTYFITNTSGG